MIGKYNLVVRNKRLVYDITLERKYTIIRGDSGTGKTELCRFLSQGEKLGVQVTSSINYVVPNSVDAAISLMQNRNNYLIVLDEDVIFQFDRDIFIQSLKKSNNYFLLVTRLKLDELPYSVKEIYELRGEKYNRLQYKNEMISRFSESI